MSHGKRAGARVWRMVASGVLNGLVPLAAYALVRPYAGSDATALAIAAGIPVACTAAVFAARRRIDPIGVVALLGYGVALLALLLSGGNPLVLKLHEAVLTGPLGVAGLVSVVVGRPLYLVVLRRVARRNPAAAAMLRRPDIRRVAAVLTTILGGTLAIHALVMLVLAVRLPTGTYLAVARPIGWALLAGGVGILLWYRARLRARREAASR
ncbi:VC0807 family protein [Nonomuraea sp. KM90]|uniref:VC0807 family protein n=1 Tax=Nonomuraea sp. KM90 TaxID=3457428 RepID=UPI003FCEAC95